jgi:uncharacterized membrane protein
VLQLLLLLLLMMMILKSTTLMVPRQRQETPSRMLWLRCVCICYGSLVRTIIAEPLLQHHQ